MKIGRDRKNNSSSVREAPLPLAHGLGGGQVRRWTNEGVNGVNIR